MMVNRDTPARADPALLATELRVVIGRLVRRLRAEHTFPLSHASVLGRLDREGALSVSDLAAADHVRHQSMAQTVADLESDRLVRRSPDPDDRRRALVALTEQGHDTLQAERRRREGWLAGAISDLSEPERKALWEALDPLSRLAENEGRRPVGS